MKETKKELEREIKLSRMERGLEDLANYMQKRVLGWKRDCFETGYDDPTRNG